MRREHTVGRLSWRPLRRPPRIPVPPEPPAPRNPLHYLRDRDIQHAAVVTALPIAAESTLPRQWRHAGLLLAESGYLMWIDLGLRWAQLIGCRRMRARIS